MAVINSASDEIYARLAYSGDHACMSNVYPEGTILTSGFSKWSSAGGWRLGYAHFPPLLSSLYNAVLRNVNAKKRNLIEFQEDKMHEKT